jgi:hypothetical protein
VARLWNRGGGIFRVLSIGVLVLGLISGIFVAERETREDKTSTTATLDSDADAIAKDDDVRHQLAQNLTEHKNAQAKAEEVATKDAEQAQAAEATARQSQAAARSQSRSTKPGVDAGPVPESCAAYSGNKAIGCTMLLQAGFGLDQMPCLAKLWDKESGWRTTASNGSSGAYGIPQAYPGSKMAAYGDDWKTNPATQIAWGLNYIKGRYKTPCGAWSYFQANNSY